MRKGLLGPWSACGDSCGHRLGPGNTNHGMSGGWVPGIAPSQYTHRYYPSRYPPCTAPLLRYYRTRHTCCTGVLSSTKEILGVDNALRIPVLGIPVLGYPSLGYPSLGYPSLGYP